MGSLVPPALVARIRADEAKLAARINALFDEHDVLLMPVINRSPVEVGRWEGRGGAWTWATIVATFAGTFTAPWNFTGQPAASVPAGFNADGLPLSAQLVGRPNDEATILSLAGQLEAELGWAERRPPVS